MENIKNEKTKMNVSLFKIMKTIYPFIYACCPVYYTTNLIISIIHGCSWAAGVMATQILFDTVSKLPGGGSTYIQAFSSLALVCGVLLMQQILNGVSNYMWTILNTRINGFVSRKVAEKSTRLDPIIFENTKILDDINKASAGAESSLWVAGVLLFILTFYVPYFVFMAWYLFSLKPILVLSILFAFIPKIISLLIKAPLHAKLEDESAPIRREYNFYEKAICDREYFKETRMLGAFNFFKKYYDSSIKLLNKKTWNTNARSASIDLVMNILSLCSYFGILYLLFTSLISGDITIGAFAAVFSSIGMIIGIMDEVICRHLGNISTSIGKVGNLVRFLELEERNGDIEKVDWTGDIQAKNISFRYPNAEKDSLTDISLTIKAGETIAIVGENGAGKTTIVKLLTGLYTPTEGNVTINGDDTSRITPNALYNGISGVFQKYQRYQLTLKENIEISETIHNNSKDNSDMLEKASEKAGVDLNSQSFPDGYNTMLSREFDGVDLSGGQWQRIAIARGFYRIHDTIVLDEPTAAIDPIEESNIYKKFAELSMDKTAIIVTHRLGSAQIADRIIVMDGGRIVEEGSHDELLAASGHYAKMYRSQADWYEQ